MATVIIRARTFLRIRASAVVAVGGRPCITPSWQTPVGIHERFVPATDAFSPCPAVSISEPLGYRAIRDDVRGVPLR